MPHTPERMPPALCYYSPLSAAHHWTPAEVRCSCKCPSVDFNHFIPDGNGITSFTPFQVFSVAQRKVARKSLFPQELAIVDDTNEYGCESEDRR